MGTDQRKTDVQLEPLEARRLLSAGHLHEHDADVFVTQTNLVSDGFVPAQHLDKNLVNPWGVSFSPTSPFWVSDNGTGVATLYDGTGAPQPPPNPATHTTPLVVTIPGGGGASPANRTGQVFNSVGGFNVSSGGKSGSSVFIFVGEDGGISGWSPGVDRTHAILAVDHSAVPDAANGAVYKGAALVDLGGGKGELFVTNFRAGTIEAYDQTFTQVHLPSSAFQDRHVPAGFAPFNVANIGGNLYVTYAKQNDEKHDDVAGPGNGFVDEYSVSGKLLRRFDHGSFLNSPWGLTQAPASWGRLAGDILVGQFGDGRIDIFSPKGEFRGFLRGQDGNPIVNDGLWTLTFGNGANSSDKNTLYFTAGLNGEMDGLFGSLTLHTQQDQDDLGNNVGNAGGDNSQDQGDHGEHHGSGGSHHR